jgi:hypothetical protein
MIKLFSYAGLYNLWISITDKFKEFNNKFRLISQDISSIKQTVSESDQIV